MLKFDLLNRKKDNELIKLKICILLQSQKLSVFRVKIQAPDKTVPTNFLH